MKTAQEQVAWESKERGLATNLLRILERHTGMPGLAYAVAPAPLAGGFWASLYGFRLAHAPGELSGELVLRVLPAGEKRCLREVVMQAAVSAAGFPAPRVYLSGGREAGLGWPFIIMARAPGGTLVTGLHWRDKARALWRMPVLLAETMAQLHALDPSAVPEALASVGVETVLAGLAKRIQPLELEGFASGMAWLYDHQPVERSRVVCHGDFHPFNLMIFNGRTSALLDWTNARLADPAFDVAYTSQLLALWPVEVPVLPRLWLKRVVGRFAAWRFLREYRRRARVEIGDLSWYEALHSLRLLVRVARARTGITLPPLSRNHPWKLVATDAATAFHRHTGIKVELPSARERPAAS